MQIHVGGILDLPAIYRQNSGNETEDIKYFEYDTFGTMTKTAPDGLVLLHKQPGITSFDALRDIKRALGTGKAGHTGTLDKFAEGLLLVLTGRALKLSRWFTHCDKQYEGVIRFGAETDTLDPEGAIIAEAPLPSREKVEQALAQFYGEILQTPPAYSAIHINGARASALARRGEAPKMQKRPVTIYHLGLRSWEPPFAQIYVHCSSGTYIRSLTRDIALACGSRAHLTALVRTRVAGFKLENAFSMSNEQSSSSFFLSINNGIFEKLGVPCVEISPEDARKVVQGKPLTPILKDPLWASNSPLSGENTAAALFSDGAFIAMIEWINHKWNYGYVFANN